MIELHRFLLSACNMKLFVFVALAVHCNAGWTDSLFPGDKASQELRSHSNLRDPTGSNRPAADQPYEYTLPNDYFDKGDDLRKYLNPSLTDDALQTIAEQLSDGMVVVIRNAMDPLFAEAVYRDLYDAEYAVDQDYHASGSHYHFHRLKQRNTDTLNRTFALFNATDTKKWMSEMSNRDCMGDSTVRGEYYANGDHSLPTTDFIYQRTVAFDWHLSRDWKPEWGGALYWCQEASQHAYIHQSFNTLVLYSVTKDTSHFVTPVTDQATEKRLSLSGWWNSNWIPQAKDNYEEILTKWKNNMTEFQYMAINFVISSDSFDKTKKQRVEPLLLEVQESQFRGFEGTYEFGEEGEGDDEEEEDDEDNWEENDFSGGDL